MKLFILNDRDNNNFGQDYYLTDDLEKCYQAAEDVDEKWYEANEQDEWIDWFAEFEKLCHERKIKIWKITEKKIYNY